MASIPDELETAVMALSRDERAELAKRLIDSLEQDEGFDSIWAEEVKRRLDAYHAGTIEAHDGEEVHTEARRLIKT